LPSLGCSVTDFGQRVCLGREPEPPKIQCPRVRSGPSKTGLRLPSVSRRLLELPASTKTPCLTSAATKPRPTSPSSWTGGGGGGLSSPDMAGRWLNRAADSRQSIKSSCSALSQKDIAAARDQGR
jgi:hypothetical protein